LKVLIIGANGFIGNALVARILDETTWSVIGLDLKSDRLDVMVGHPRFHFFTGDISTQHDLVDDLILQADVVLPLAACAIPTHYVRDPLGTFSLDFEENLRIIRKIAASGRRLIFPSTSEVYGLCSDDAFDEATSRLVMGPIQKDRWIYACSKQLLDRIIWALGGQGLQFTIFRPFNWFGPNLDDIHASAPGSARVVTQFLGHLLRCEPIQLVDGGTQRRTFTYIDDGINGLMCILRNPNGLADQQVFNLGNPANFISIRGLAETLIQELAGFKSLRHLSARACMHETSGRDYYGDGYEDMPHRRPRIDNAAQLGWTPTIPLRSGLQKLIEHEITSGRWRIDAAIDPQKILVG
jgi:nucleoside-diphosphate-sugar epimerase